MNETEKQDESRIWPAVGMVVTATVLMAISADVLVVPSLIVSAIVLYVFTGWPKMPRPRAFFTLLWFVPFLFWFRYDLGGLSQLYVPVVLLNVMAFYVLTLATHHVLAHRRGGSMDHVMGCSLLALCVAGAGDREHLLLYGMGLMIFAVLMFVHLRMYLIVRRETSSRREAMHGRYFVSLAALFLIAVVIEQVFVPKVPDMGRWLLDKTLPRVPQSIARGHGSISRLGSMPEQWGRGQQMEHIMLRVFARQIDPYLRGGVYSDYDVRNPSWRNEGTTTHQVLEPKGSYLGRNLFNARNVLTKGGPSGTRLGEIYAEPEYGDVFFLPMGVHEVASFSDGAREEWGHTIRPQEHTAVGGYTLFTPTNKQLSPPVQRDLKLPEGFAEKLSEKKKEIFSSEMDSFEKFIHLESWFARNYNYNLGIQIESFRRGVDGDPIIQFLFEKEEAHCEYFASAAVMLLRAEGIPARYVTGFLVKERGLGGQYWIARRKHAHAWVEAYVEGVGWFTVDPTPPGVLDTTPQAASQQWKEWFDSQRSRLTHVLFYGGIGGLLAVLWDLIASVPGMIPLWAWVSMGLFGLIWIFRERWLALFRHKEIEPVSEHIQTMRQKLEDAERTLSQFGVRRPPTVTVAQFLRAVKATSNLPGQARESAIPLLEEYVQERFRPEDNLS